MNFLSRMCLYHNMHSCNTNTCRNGSWFEVFGLWSSDIVRFFLQKLKTQFTREHIFAETRSKNFEPKTAGKTTAMIATRPFYCF